MCKYTIFKETHSDLNQLCKDEQILPTDIEEVNIMGFGVDNDFYFEPHLALFIKLQEAFPKYEKQFTCAQGGLPDAVRTHFTAFGCAQEKELLSKLIYTQKIFTGLSSV